MISDSIDLYAYFKLPRKGAKAGTLKRFLHGQITESEGLQKIRPAMLVLPGGGYAFVSQRENESVAFRYFAEGYNVFVLEYDIAPVHYPAQILEAGMAMLYLRREAAALDIDGEHIAAVGFSAGGHLLGCIAILWDDPALKAAFGDECARIRPDAAVYSYPVVTDSIEKGHVFSFKNFCGDVVPHEAYSLEKHVRREAAPAFIWATSEDGGVPVENSVLLYSALHEAGVPAELHLFECGPHGLSTADADVYPVPLAEPYFARAANWVPLSFTFLKGHGFAIKNK